MGELFLYSTNIYLKYFINREYFDDRHYVWCSHRFSADDGDGWDPDVPPTSNPADIYRTLTHAVDKQDVKNPKISQQKSLLISLARKFFTDGLISEEVKEEITAIVRLSNIIDFRPIIYLIPRNKLSLERIIKVKRKYRGGLGPEYIIPDLKGNEFEKISLFRR